MIILVMTSTARVTVTQSTQPDQNNCYGNQGGAHLLQVCVRACAHARAHTHTHTHTHTQGCLKMYLYAVHNKCLLAVFFKIYTFQIYARHPEFLPLLKLIMELCVGLSVTALEFQGHSGNNSLVYLYNNHSALIHYFILRFCLTCFGLSYSQSTRGYVYSAANGDYLLECRPSMGQDGAPSWPIDSRH
jgi:hypothetical protein